MAYHINKLSYSSTGFSMRYCALAAIVAFSFPAELDAEPWSGSSIGPDGDLLQFSCVPSDSGVRCEFVQILMRVAADDSDLEEQLSNIEAAIEEFTAEGGYALNETCRTIPIISSIIEYTIQGRWDELDALGSIYRNEENSFFNPDEAISSFRSMDPRTLGDINRTMAAMGELCKGVTPARVEALIRTQHEQDARTCRPLINTWDAEFSRVSDEVWTISGQNAFGDCGVVRLDRFECERDYSSLCTFVSEKRVLNPNGQMSSGLSCSVLEQEAFVYDWRSEPRYLKCDRIDF